MEAHKNYIRQDFPRSRSILLDLIEKNDDWIPPRILNGKILYFTRKFSGAENQFRNILSMEPDHPYAQQWLARTIATDPGRTGEAIKLLKRILDRNPDDITAHYLLARCATRAEKPRLAISHFKDALRGSRILQKTHLELGRLLQSLGLDKRADKHLHWNSDHNSPGEAQKGDKSNVSGK
tara:strand:- start:17005 stop:17544 length:540 start_codon:yes stop_codon:yes gene_type:complete